MKNETGTFEGRELKKLFYQCWLPDTGEIKAYIIALHGWGTSSDRLKNVSEYLTGNGYATYAFDLRGHGKNAGNIPGHIDSMDHILKDTLLFMDFIKTIANEKKIFMMGHSFGGLISLVFAIHHPNLPGVLVSSPLLGMYLKLSLGKKVIKSISKNITKLSPNKMLDYNVDQNQLTSDLKILREYIADKNKIKVMSAKSAADIEQFSKWAMENASNLLCPTLIMQAGSDKIADSSKTKKFFEKARSADKTYKEYPGFLHELWNEKNRAQVYQDMYVWLEKHL
ncbi:MAG: alpha/beta hydrolase [Candidatus Lokiarchaeia archaeon]|nr:alpha/beta hydrolase [Candidatus Lokiarchaeia archaeon]